jgi:hypothetical protein
LTLDRPCPEVGDYTKLVALVDGVAGMTAAFRPMVDEHFAATLNGAMASPPVDLENLSP